MIVLDASAVFALVQAEPGGEVVRAALASGEPAVLGAANWAECVGKLVDAGGDSRAVRRRLDPLVRVVPVTEDDANLAGALRAKPWARPLSLGDRLCLALAARIPNERVLTADRAWAACDLPLTVSVIR